jgi:tripartite-type tricarboxylate transporter receptor subunit TctC
VKLPRRKFLHLAAGATALPAVSRIARAQTYPTRALHLIVGFAAGGPADTIARLISQRLSERLGQSFIIENRPGAGSNLATEMIVRARPDGYTLLFATPSNAWNVTLYDNLSFNFVRDIAPIAGISREPGVVVVNPSLPVATIPEFIAYAKSNPGKINMGTGGSGSAAHVYGEMFRIMTGINMVHVPYRGGGPALIALLGGQVQVFFGPVIVSIPYIRSGKLRPLGVTTATRIDVLPDIPPVCDFVPGYEGSGWSGIGAPANTPPEIIAILNREVNAALTDPTFKARFIDLGVQPFASSPAEFAKFIAEYTEKWAKVIRTANIKAE